MDPGRSKAAGAAAHHGDLAPLSAIASNLPFSERGQVVADPRLVVAIVDRVTFGAHVIETGSDSYRLRATRAKRSG
jgi:DNA replication protein DnaC